MKAAEVRTFNSLQIGETAFFTHEVTKEDIARFAEISGDYSPLHVDDAYARAAGYQGVVTHGFFIGALVSRLVGMHMPGAYALLMQESLKFSKPVFVGETVSIRGTVISKSEATKLIGLNILVQRGEITVVSGSVSVQVLK